MQKLIILTLLSLLQYELSMTKLTRDDVLKLANLARLDLSQAEIDEFAEELSDILNYVEQLQAVEVNDLKPTNQVSGLTNVYREDQKIDYGYEPAELLKNVPLVEDQQIKTRRMID